MAELGSNTIDNSQDAVNPLDIKKTAPLQDDSAIIKDILSTEDEKLQGNLLEEAPTVDMSLLEDITPPKSIPLIALKLLFLFLVVATVGVVVFFTWQLTDRFEFVNSRFNIQTLSGDVAKDNDQILKLKTDLNYYKYLETKAYLDEFSYYGDSFLQFYEIAQSQTSTSAEKNQANTELLALRENLRTAFEKARNSFTLDISVPLTQVPSKTEQLSSDVFETELIEKFRRESQKLAEIDEPEAKREYKHLVNASSLIKNVPLNDVLKNTDFATLSDADLYALVKKVNSLIVNNMSTLQKIKDTRIKWSDIMNEIDLKTIAVDKHYSEDFYNVLGGIRYTSYDLDAEQRTISIIGELKRFDTINFTMITNLIEQLNASGLFGDAEMRSFSKSGSVEEGYTSSIKLTVKLKDQNQ